MTGLEDPSVNSFELLEFYFIYRYLTHRISVEGGEQSLQMQACPSGVSPHLSSIVPSIGDDPSPLLTDPTQGAPCFPGFHPESRVPP